MPSPITIDADEMAEIQAELAHFSVDLAYYSAHYEELLSRYPGLWIAIFGQTVVGTGTDRERLVQDLRAQEILPERALIVNPSAEQETLIV
jgi:hypothetical protein